jgi:hypothetical protein
LQRAAGIICSCILLSGLALACCAAGELVFDVVAHGARGDGRTDDTKVRVRAIHLLGPSDGRRRRPAEDARALVLTYSTFFVVFLSIKAFEAAWKAACGAKGPSAVMVVPAQRSFLVGPVSFQGPCASGRVTVQVRARQVPMSCMSVVSPFLLHRDK